MPPTSAIAWIRAAMLSGVTEVPPVVGRHDLAGVQPNQNHARPGRGLRPWHTKRTDRRQASVRVYRTGSVRRRRWPIVATYHRLL
jgi:hypothetical protein